MVSLGGLVLGSVIGYFLRHFWAAKQLGSLEQQTAEKIKKAESEAKEILLSAKEKASVVLEETQKEEKERKKEILVLESRIHEREESLEKKLGTLEQESAKLRGEREQ